MDTSTKVVMKDEQKIQIGFLIRLDKEGKPSQFLHPALYSGDPNVNSARLGWCTLGEAECALAAQLHWIEDQGRTPSIVKVTVIEENLRPSCAGCGCDLTEETISGWSVFGPDSKRFPICSACNTIMEDYGFGDWL